MIINYAYAQNQGVTVAVSFLEKFNDVILFPLITLMMAVAFLFFLYGCFEYIIHADNETARATGRQHILYGIIGLLVMLSAMAILRIAVGTFGLEKDLDCANDPLASGCDLHFSPWGPDGGNPGIGGGDPGIDGGNP